MCASSTWCVAVACNEKFTLSSTLGGCRLATIAMDDPGLVQLLQAAPPVSADDLETGSASCRVSRQQVLFVVRRSAHAMDLLTR